MTTLVLAHKKIKSLFPVFNFSGAGEWLEAFNRKGAFTYLLAGLILMFVIIYLIALYFIFGLGFKLRIDNKTLSDLNKEVSSIQFRVEEAETSLVKNKAVFLEFMEEISSIRYLTPEDTTISFKQN